MVVNTCEEVNLHILINILSIMNLKQYSEEYVAILDDDNSELDSKQS